MKEYLKKLSWADRIAYIVILFCMLCGIYASLIEPFRLKVTNWTVSTEKWSNPKEIRIAILTDLHMIKPWMTPAHLQKIVDKTNSLNPDIVVLLGDYVATHPFGIQLNANEALAPLKNLKSRCGTYAVIGNHDLEGKTKNIWPQALIKTGIPVLRNESHEVQCNGQKFWLAGLKEYWMEQPAIPSTLEQVSDDKPIIMLMHNPDLFANMPEQVALSLAGHTHGGQIRLPFVGALKFVIPSDYGLRYVYGHINEQGKDLIVSSGLGMTGLPMRFLTPPEIAVVTLKSQAK